MFSPQNRTQANNPTPLDGPSGRVAIGTPPHAIHNSRPLLLLTLQEVKITPRYRGAADSQNFLSSLTRGVLNSHPAHDFEGMPLRGPTNTSVRQSLKSNILVK